jgi:DNA-binding NtrC family response regulator
MPRRRGIDVVLMSQASAPPIVYVVDDDVSGLDLQKRIIDRTDIPIIFITGYGDVAMTVQPMKAGAVEFLTNLDLGRLQRINLSFPRV